METGGSGLTGAIGEIKSDETIRSFRSAERATVHGDYPCDQCPQSNKNPGEAFDCNYGDRLFEPLVTGVWLRGYSLGRVMIDRFRLGAEMPLFAAHQFG